MVAVPTYLYLRNGIYYFQLRIPKDLSNTVYHGKGFIRKSTGTGNRREALRIARLWWVKIMTNDEIGKKIEDMEMKLNHEERLYIRGKELYGILQSYDDLRDPRAIEEFLILHYKDQVFDENALNYYIDCLQETEVAPISKQKLTQVTSSQKPFASKFPSKKISDLVQDYISDRSHGSKSWAIKTKNKFEQQLLVFVEMIDDPLDEDLTIDIITKKFTHHIHKLPVSMGTNKKLFYSGKTRKNIDEILKITEEMKLQTISQGTIWSNIGTVKSFLNWAAKREYLKENLDIAFEKYKKPTAQEKNNRQPFTKQELEQIFYSEHFTIGQSMYNYPEKHWIPIISLFSGARLGEIAQLHLEDIIQDKDSKIWYISINDEGDKKVKTQKSNRIIPIHQDLIALGFLKYLAYQKERKQTQLFPNLSPNSVGDWGGEVSKWFARQLRKYKIKSDTDKSKTFHSFRHTVINYEKQNGLDKHVMSEIVGHAFQQSSVHSGYQQEFSLERKKIELNKLQYGLDISKIRKWT